MISTADALERGREAVRRQAWGDAHAQLSAADGEAPLGLEDFERLAVVAHLVGREDESADSWARAHHECLSRGEASRATRCAFWLAFSLLNRGEMAQAGGWLARARRLLEEVQDDCGRPSDASADTGRPRGVAGELSPSDPGARYRRLVACRSGSLRCPDDSGGAACRFNQGLMSVCPLDPIANAHLALDDF